MTAHFALCAKSCTSKSAAVKQQRCTYAALTEESPVNQGQLCLRASNCPRQQCSSNEQHSRNALVMSNVYSHAALIEESYIVAYIHQG